MGVKVSVKGIRDAGGKLGKMIALKTQCDDLKISYPDELEKYFEGTEALDMEDADDALRAAIEVDLKYDLEIEGLLEGDVEYGDGMILDLTKLPDDIKKLRVCMS